MKICLPIITVLVVSLSVNAQNANAIDSVVSSNAFINLPLQPHKKRVDIFFNCDRPKQPFYNIKVLDVSGSIAYQDLLTSIQEKARNEGFDGLIILGKSNYTSQDYSVGSAVISGLAQGTTAAVAGKLTNSNNTYSNHNQVYTPYVNTVSVLSAIGIKYQSNMQYVTTIIKNAFVQQNGANKKDTLSFNLNGELIRDNFSASNFYENNIHLFERCDYFALHAMHESSARYSFDVDFSTTIKIDNPFGDGNIRYKVLYANDSMLSKVQMKIPSNDAQTDAKIYDVVYDLNNDKTINKRYVRLGRKADLIFTDSYQYDKEKRCIGFTRYDEKTKATLLQVNYAYFTMNDLPRIN